MVSWRKPCFIFFNETATTEIYPLSLHDALPISSFAGQQPLFFPAWDHLPDETTLIDEVAGQRLRMLRALESGQPPRDRKSTRLNSSHANISYAVFCLKKKKYDVAPELVTLFASV